MKIPSIIKSNKGASSVYLIILSTAIIVFVILPLFAAVSENYIINLKLQKLKAAIDITNIATYNSMSAESLSMVTVDMSNDKLQGIYKDLLASNLKLNKELSPLPNSIAENTVTIKSLVFYGSNFPTQCPNGKTFIRPGVHSVVDVPVRPTLFRKLILDAMGKDYVDLVLHVDSDIPIDN